MKSLLATIVCLVSSLLLTSASDSAISYQGMLRENNQPVTGTYDFLFQIFPTDTGGVAQAASTNLAVTVTNSQFIAYPDFGDGFDSQAVWLGVSVRTNGAATFTPLGGRQRIAAAPKAIHATKADQAQTALGVEASIVNTAALQDQAVTSSKIENSTIVDADIANTAAISDTKLATISTAGKVANSATTATSSNVPNAIVSRDSSGSFAAGTISGTDLDATGFVRSGSESGTAEPPALPGMVIRRFDSSVMTSNSVVAVTDNCNLVRDGTPSGLRVQYTASGERLSVHAVGLSVFGTNVLFRTTITAASSGGVQVFRNAQRVIHADITFGNVYAEGAANVTQVFINRYDDGVTTNDYYMTGTILSSFNQ